MKVMTPEFRVAFPNVYQARKNDLNGKDEYSVVALFPKGADLKVLEEAAMTALKKKFGEDQSAWPQNLRSPFRKQDERIDAAKRENKAVPQGYEPGCFYLTLRSTQKPGVVDQQVNPILDAGEFYGGCWAKASVHAYAYDNKGNRGVSFGLGNIQKLRDDDHFGNRTKPEDDFQAVEISEEASETQSGGASTNSLFS